MWGCLFGKVRMHILMWGCFFNNIISIYFKEHIFLQRGSKLLKWWQAAQCFTDRFYHALCVALSAELASQQFAQEMSNIAIRRSTRPVPLGNLLIQTRTDSYNLQSICLAVTLGDQEGTRGCEKAQSRQPCRLRQLESWGRLNRRRSPYTSGALSSSRSPERSNSDVKS